MATPLGKRFEYFLISDDKFAVLVLPILAFVFSFAALYGAGAFGKPDLTVGQLLRSHTETTPTALRNSDSPSYEQWVGPPSVMSDFIKDQVNENLRLATDDTSFEGKSFSDALRFTELGDVAAQETEGGNGAVEPQGGAGEGQDPAPLGPLAASTAALDKWTQDYWCQRRGWGVAWHDEIVRPLVARGVGDCSTLERFYARSPLISGLGAVWGVGLFILLWLFAGVSVFLFAAQWLLREAYRMSYRSAVLGG
ncbi:MAG: hypothetical protein SXU28_11560 [Pseudomonadota bacterium]|nr:hypothetical protein [Pseudomonadota bacterium]